MVSVSFNGIPVGIAKLETPSPLVQTGVDARGCLTVVVPSARVVVLGAVSPGVGSLVG
jgi:hypothetical protein